MKSDKKFHTSVYLGPSPLSLSPSFIITLSVTPATCNCVFFPLSVTMIEPVFCQTIVPSCTHSSVHVVSSPTVESLVRLDLEALADLCIALSLRSWFIDVVPTFRVHISVAIFKVRDLHFVSPCPNSLTAIYGPTVVIS
jgi:hypothetical protein